MGNRPPNSGLAELHILVNDLFMLFESWKNEFHVEKPGALHAVSAEGAEDVVDDPETMPDDGQGEVRCKGAAA